MNIFSPIRVNCFAFSSKNQNVEPTVRQENTRKNLITQMGHQNFRLFTHSTELIMFGGKFCVEVSGTRIVQMAHDIQFIVKMLLTTFLYFGVCP